MYEARIMVMGNVKNMAVISTLKRKGQSDPESKFPSYSWIRRGILYYHVGLLYLHLTLVE
jgi:hypothetical protein